MTAVAFDVLLYIFEMVIAHIFISYNYEKRLSNLPKTLLVGTVVFVAGALLFTYVNNDVLNLLIFFLMNLIFFAVCYNIGIYGAVIYSIVLTAIMFSSEMITIYGYSLMFKAQTDAYQTNFTVFIILAIISKVVYFALSQILAFIINRFKFKQRGSFRFFPLLIFPAISVAISLVFLKMSFAYDYNGVYNTVFVIINVLFVVASVYIFVYYQRLLKNEEEIRTLYSEKQSYDINNSYLKVLEHQNEEMQMLFHDTKNHFLTINSMDNTQQIKAYIANIMGDIQRYAIIKRTNNKMLDLLLSKYVVLCNSKGISLDIEAKTANLNYIDDGDLSILINNIMDNAVEAAENSTKRTISLSLRRINSFDVFSVTNSCDIPPHSAGARLITTKVSKNMHGYGTKIIKKYASKNNAQYNWSYDKATQSFSTTIIFPKH